ncbi:MAG: hypothetical protein JJU20_08480 [Opitutales bacterium]|nr:hypothetical protein [Opitutales bacterium]
MNATDQLSEILEQFETIGNRTHALLVKENEQLQDRSQEADPSLLDQKRDLIEQLDELVQRCREAAYSAGGEQSSIVNRLQARYLKLLMLDRENERLLLQSTMPKPPPVKAPVRNLSQAYQRSCSSVS